MPGVQAALASVSPAANDCARFQGQADEQPCACDGVRGHAVRSRTPRGQVLADVEGGKGVTMTATPFSPSSRACMMCETLIHILEVQERKSGDARDTRILVLARELLAAIETRWT